MDHRKSAMPAVRKPFEPKYNYYACRKVSKRKQTANPPIKLSRIARTYPPPLQPLSGSEMEDYEPHSQSAAFQSTY